MAKKRKSESISAGITKEQYNQALVKYASNDTRINTLTAELEAELESIREEYADDLELLGSEQKMHMAIVKSYCMQNRDDLFSDKKSIETLFGKIGFRKSPPALKTITGFTWEKVTDKLKELLPAYVRTKEEPDKEKLMADRDDEKVSKHFGAVGVKVSHDEVFYIELKAEEIVPV